ncbi:MAG: tRNA pseudouridine synthase [Candidatus Brocadiaceae bacterium]|nr:tRNA pseudouridine synthase [Candidatus Brocadiaceae bacterium]
MRNIRLQIEYDGANYSGWQTQKNDKTVQETLSHAIWQALQEKITIHGAGRTDAGVHALGQVAHFKTGSSIPANRLVHAINYYLPHDIVVKSAVDVPETFHAQYSTKSKVYQYTVLNDWTRSAINRNFCYVYGYALDVEKMTEAAKLLIGAHDFTSFTTKAIEDKNRVRTVQRLDIRKEGKYLYFTIEADGFLYNMVRTIVGTLLEVGRGKIAGDAIKDILNKKNRIFAGPTAPARGLCLMEITYIE